MIRAHQIELRPTPDQERYFRRCAGTMRFVYNRLVARAKGEGVKYSRKEFQKFSSTMRAETDWMREVSSRATYEAADNFHRAMTNFFDSCKGKRKGRKIRFPSFKKKGVKESFQFSHAAQFRVADRSLTIQGLKQKIRMRERIRFDGAVKAVTIKLHGGKWFAVFRVELPRTARPREGPARKPSVGIDFGLKELAVLSTGERIANPRHLRRKLRLLRRRQRQASRRKPGSNRRSTAKRRVARIHRKISDQRKAFHHGFVNSIVSRFGRIVIEDLNVAGMVKNRRLARSISDVGWGSARSILEYKAEANGAEVVVADRWFASSRLCSDCGWHHATLTLKDRTFRCGGCGAVKDRDHNAAMNLEKYTPSPPIKGRRKTDAVGMCKTSPGAVLPDGVNNRTLTGDPAESSCEQEAVFY